LPDLVARVEGRLERVALPEQALRLAGEVVHRRDLAEGPAEVLGADRAPAAARHAGDLPVLLLPADGRLEEGPRVPRRPAGGGLRKSHLSRLSERRPGRRARVGPA